VKKQQRGPVWKFAGECKVEGVLVAEATITAMYTDEEA
jgi:3-hydroxyacyl-[acyl-carrier-protein] dehydratase